MAVKILIKRKVKPGTLKDASAILIQARKNAMVHKGYISTETLVDYDDPTIITVISMWQKRENWDNYVASAMRQENEQKFAEILDGETAYEIYKMGM